MSLLYFDDLAVGQTFTSTSHTLTADEITTFAAHYDPQPFHLDHEAAKATLFGGLAASGWHTAAITMRLLVTNTTMNIAGGLIGAGGEIAWPRPTRPGDTLTVRSEIVDLIPSKSKPNRGTITVRNETVNQNGEVVQSFVVKMVGERRVAASPSSVAS